MGFDYYEVHPARGAVARVHIEWRRDFWNPDHLPQGITQDMLQKTRVTQQEFGDGTMDVVQDEWGGTPRGKTKVTRKDRKAWVGTTWFFLHGEKALPGPA